MEINNHFTFDVAIGDKRVNNKNTYNWNSIHYTTETMGIDDFINKVKEGYPFNSVMSKKKFNAKEKTQYDFRQTSFVSLDFDNVPDTFEKAYAETDLVPTFAYTTPNDGKPGKGNRFRFVYAMSQPITSIAEYKAIYLSITSRFGLETDNSLKSGVQNIGGMSASGRLKITYNIYDKEEFLDKTNYNFDKNIYGESIFKNNNKRKKGEDGIILNETFEKDLEELDFREFLEKYRTEYEYFVNTPLTFNDGYAIIPNDYYEIKRKWVNETFETSTGIKDIRSVYRLKDGDGRRNKMFVQCLIRRKIKPDITLEELVYNLVCERQWFFDNDDNQLNNQELIRIARNSLKVDEITIPPTGTEKKFVVDKAYWAEMDINANQAKQMIKKMFKDDEIGNLYDPSLTDKENLEVFRQYGMKCSKVTLARWKKANGLTRAYNKKSEMKTINENNKTEMVTINGNNSQTPMNTGISEDSSEKNGNNKFEMVTINENKKKSEMKTINDKHGIELPKEVEDMFTDKLGERGTMVPYKQLRTQTVDDVLQLASWIECKFSDDTSKVHEYKHALNDWFNTIKRSSLQRDYIMTQLTPEKNKGLDLGDAAEQIAVIVEGAIADRFENARANKRR